MKLLCAALGVVCAAVVSAPTSTADDGSYLGAVGDLANLVGNVPSLLKVGSGACTLLAPSNAAVFGVFPGRVVELVQQKNPKLARDQAVRIVNAAEDNLCPDVSHFGRAS